MDNPARTKAGTPAVLASLALVAAALSTPAPAMAQSLAPGGGTVAEDNFREVFLTAGYSAAFGAALGAAILPFMPNPSLSSLRYVAGGASLGFIVGSGIAFFNLSSAPSNSNSFEPAPENGPDAGFDDDEVNPVSQSRGRLRSLPQLPANLLPVGSLVVGDGRTLGLSLPAFAPVGRGALVSVLDYRF